MAGADPEELVSSLLATLGAAEQALSSWARELRAEPAWTNVRCAVSLLSAAGSGKPAGFSGAVSGERSGVGSFSWRVEVFREAHGWQIVRSHTLDSDTLRYDEPLVELPTVNCPDTPALAQTLPGLVSELVELPASGSVGGG